MDRAADLLRNAQKIEVFTGAGMSADSGIATYRDAETGLWENVDPTAMASIDAWAVRPKQMWAWYLWRASLSRRAEPNAGHLAVAELGTVRDVTVTTQNIDDLHERGGSKDVAHLHGSLFAFRCSICSRPWRGEVDLLEEPVAELDPPECPLCGNLVRPGVVWFGEPLPEREWALAERRMREADALVIVGTSGVVQPAASLPLLAVDAGTPVIEVSPQPTELTRYVDVHIDATAAHALPQLVAAVKGQPG